MEQFGDGTRHSDPARVGELIDVVLGRIAGGGAQAELLLREVWETVSDERWAGRAAPAELRDGTVVVDVADGATATILRYEKDRLVAELRRAAPDLGVENLTVRVRPR